MVGTFEGRNPKGLDPGVVFGPLAVDANSVALKKVRAAVGALVLDHVSLLHADGLAAIVGTRKLDEVVAGVVGALKRVVHRKVPPYLGARHRPRPGFL